MILDVIDHGIVYENGLYDFFPSVHHTVSDRFNLFDVLQTSGFSLCQQIDQDVQSGGMVGNNHRTRDAPAGTVMIHFAGRVTDPLHNTPGLNRSSGHFKKPVLDGGTAAVQNEYFHAARPFRALFSVRN